MTAPATDALLKNAKFMDLSEHRVQKLSRKGSIPNADQSPYELVSALQGYFRYLRERSLEVELISADS